MPKDINDKLEQAPIGNPVDARAVQDAAAAVKELEQAQQEAAKVAAQFTDAQDRSTKGVRGLGTDAKMSSRLMGKMVGAITSVSKANTLAVSTNDAFTGSVDRMRGSLNTTVGEMRTYGDVVEKNAARLGKLSQAVTSANSKKLLVGVLKALLREYGHAGKAASVFAANVSEQASETERAQDVVVRAAASSQEWATTSLDGADSADAFRRNVSASADSVEDVTEKVDRSTESLKRWAATAQEGARGAKDAAAAAREKAEAVGQEARQSQGAADGTESWTDASREAAGAAAGVAEAADEATEAFRDLNDVVDDGTGTVGDWEKKAGEARDGAEELGDELDELADSSDNASDALDELNDSASSFGKEVNKQAGLLGLLNKRLKEGAEEANRFADGMGESATGALAAGLAIYMMTQKVAELVDKYKDAAVEFAKFRTEQARLAKSSLIAPGGPEQLREMRDELGLTTKQFESFTDVLQTGVNEGVASVEKLVVAGKQLQEVFGGDQTERLREYVDLLKEIPSLETDLSVTASLDDQAAAWFAMAEAGKVEQVIELQMAGLAGGVEVEQPKGQEKDVDLLNSAQATEKWSEDISQTMHSFFPTWGPQLGAIAGGVLRVGGMLAAGIVGVKAISTLMGRTFRSQKRATKATERATEAARKTAKASTKLHREQVKMTLAVKSMSRQVSNAIYSKADPCSPCAQMAYRRGGDRVSDGIEDLKNTVTRRKKLPKGQIFKYFKRGIIKKRGLGYAIKRTAKRAVLKVGGKKMARRAFGRAAAAGVKRVTMGGVAKAGAAAGAAAAAKKGAGALAVKAGTGAAAAGFGAKALGVTATAGGPITLIAAGVLALATVMPDIVHGFDNMADGLLEGSKTIPKYNKGMRALGHTIKGVLVPVKAVGYGLKEAGSFIAESTVGIGQLIGDAGSAAARGIGKAWRGAKDWFYNDEYLKARQEEAQRTTKLVQEQQKLVVMTIKLREAQVESMKRMQQSSLQLQKIMNGLNNAADTAAQKIYEFRQELGEAELSAGAEVGGDAAASINALDMAAGAAADRFRVVIGGLETWRKEILGNEKLVGQQRITALRMLHRKELEATTRFIDALMGTVGQFDKLPEVVIAELRNQVQQAQLDVSLDIGSMTEKEIADNLDAQLGEALKGFGATATTAMTDFQRAGKAAEAIGKKNDAVSKNVSDMLGKMPSGDEFRKKVEGMLDFGGSGAGGGIKGVADRAGLAKLRAETEQEIASQEARLEAAGVNLRQQEAINKAQEEAAKAKQELEDANNQLKAFSDTEWETARARYHAAREEAAKAQQEFDTEQREATQYEVVKSKRRGLAKDRERAEKSANEAQDKVDKEQARMVRMLAENSSRLTDEEKKFLGSLGKNVNVSRLRGDRQTKYGQIQAKILGQDQAQADAAQKQLDVTAKHKATLDSLAQLQNAKVAKAKMNAQIVVGLVENMKKFFDKLDLLYETVGRSKAAQEAQRQLDILEAQDHIYSLTNDVTAQMRSRLQNQNKLLSASLQGFNENLAVMKKYEAATKDEKAMRDLVSKSVKEQAGKSVDVARGAKKSLEEMFGGTDKGITEGVEMLAGKAKKYADLMASGADRSEVDAAAKEFETDRDALLKQIEQIPSQELRERLTGMVMAMGQSVGTMDKNQKYMTAKFTQARDNMEMKFGDVTKVVVDMLDELGQRVVDRAQNMGRAQALGAKAEEAGAGAEMAKFMGDAGEMGKQVGTEITASLARGQFLAKALKEQFDVATKELTATVQSLRTQADEADKKGDSAHAKTLRRMADELNTNGRMRIESERRAALSKTELEHKEKVVSAAERERSLADELIGLQRDRIEAEIDFLSETGGSYGQILELQKKSIALVADEVGNIQQQMRRLEGAGMTNTLEYEKLRTQLVQKQFELQKKAMGAQRDAYEKLVGMAFGALRGSRGAQRGLNSEARFFGRGRTKLRSGLIAQRSSADRMNIDERAAAIATSANVPTGPVARATSTRPTRAAVENLGRGGGEGTMKDLVNATKESTKETRKGTDTTRRTAERARGGRGESPRYQGVAPAKMDAAAAERLGLKPAAEKEAEQKVQVGVKGEVTVKFDNRMFKDAVISIVASNVTNAEVANAMKKAGYVKTS